MIIREAEDIRPSEITPYSAYLNRRQLIGAGTVLASPCADDSRHRLRLLWSLNLLQEEPIEAGCGTNFLL
jgi:hypothetical protein